MAADRPQSSEGALLEQVVVGHSVMAEAIRSKDWSNSLLGSISTWQSSLITTLNTILAVPTPVQVMWGKDFHVFYNDAFIPILQHKHPAALGRSAREVWAEVWPDVGQQLETAYREGRSYSYSDMPLELLNGSELELRYFSFSYSPIRNSRAEVVGLLNLSQETTGNVIDRRSLQKSERRFRTLVDSASVGIAIGKASGELTYLNPTLQQWLEYTAEEVSRGEVRWDRLTPRRFADADTNALAQLRSAGVAEPYEKAYYSRGGTAIPLLVGAFTIPPDSSLGEDGDIAVFAVDLRKQKRTEGMLLQSEKLAAVGKLASSISHEINNPLEAVTNLLYLVRLDGDLSQQSRDYLETADRELARVSQVASQTLRFHRQSTRPMEVDPRSLLEEVLLLYSARFTNFHIGLHRSYDPEASLTCYEGDIRQVLNNLVGNAVDAMRSTGGQLSVRTRRCHRASDGDPGVLITVADTGSGIKPEDRDSIFDAFYTTKGIHGTGLGLWISYRIVHKHRGYLRMYTSVAPGHRGTVFQLWLPERLATSAREAWHEEEVSSAAPEEDFEPEAV